MINYLATLEERELRSGMAEIIKYSLTYDVKLLDAIKSFDKSNIEYLIHRSIEIKNEIVLKDPKENGLRKVLNFGHTLGHAIESYFLESRDKKNLTHGEAIAIGMVCETYLSHKVLNLSYEKMKRVKSLIESLYEKIYITRGRL